MIRKLSIRNRLFFPRLKHQVIITLFLCSIFFMFMSSSFPFQQWKPETMSFEDNYYVRDLKQMHNMSPRIGLASIKKLSRLNKLLHRPTGFCKRLVKIGGLCNNRDGSKQICLDENFFMSRNDCLIYSFGVGGDISFEKGVLALKNNCEIHLFDIGNKPKKHTEYIDSKPQITYHRAGLFPEVSEVLEKLEGDVEKVKIPLLTYDHILTQLGHMKRRVDYLKIDVEGYEWPVLEQLLYSNVLKNVHQLALELHIKILLKGVSEPDWLAALEKHLVTLHRLEVEAGFRRVFYEENYHISCCHFLPKENKNISLCGEILYIKDLPYFDK